MKKLVVILSVLLFSTSAIFMLYPTVSSFINQLFNNNTVKEYNNTVSALSDSKKDEYYSSAKQYNDNLKIDVSYKLDSTTFYVSSDKYNKILNFDNGQICSIEIPKINVNLPVYHGISEEVLKIGAAHLPNTSFPIGGTGTHSAISAHTAYPSKIFFDRLDELEVGDEFYIEILGDELCYSVCDINIVLPEDTSLLEIDDNKDYVTLITCYPYAVNSHRLLVTGERVINKSDITATQDEAIGESNRIIINTAVVVCITIFIIITVIILLIKKSGTGKN